MRAKLLKCPQCGGQIASGDTAWRCEGCGHQIPATLGIPNFMPGQPAPTEKALELVRSYAGSNFEQMFAAHEPDWGTEDPVLNQVYDNYRPRMLERGRLFYRMVRDRLGELLYEPRRRRGVALVAGCGVGACLYPLVGDFDHIIAIDPDLEVLILAKRAVEDMGASNVTFLQGIAQDMPIRDSCVDFIIAEDVIEHLIDIDTAFSEFGRVLAAGGVFAGNSVNRYNLLRPEPHVKLWFLGLLPRSLQKRYARWRRGIDGYDVWVRPPSYYALKNAVRRGVGPESCVVFPKASAFGFPAWIDRVLQVLERARPLAVLLLWIFPSHLAVARRSDRAPHTAQARPAPG